MVERRIPRQRALQERSQLNPASGDDRGTVFSCKPLSSTEREKREQNQWLSGIMQEHGQSLVHYFAIRTGGDFDRAEGIAQQVIIRAWQNKDNLDTTKSIKPWLFTVGRNILIDEVRALQARPPEVLYEPERHDRKSNDNVPGSVETRMVISEAMMKLSSDHRILIIEAYFNGLSQAEIAEKYDIPLGTVKSRMHYSLKAMKGVFAEMEIDASMFS